METAVNEQTSDNDVILIVRMEQFLWLSILIARIFLKLVR